MATVREIVMICAHDAGMSLRELADSVGMAKSNLSRSLSDDRGSGMKMTVDRFVQLIEAAGACINVETSLDQYTLDGEEDWLLDDLEEEQAFPDV